MHRVRVRNRASVGATVARRAYSPAYLCMRIDATRLFGAEIALGNRSVHTEIKSEAHDLLVNLFRIIRLEGPAVTAISAIAA
ncbi:hypothetical protein EVAR_84672_1 [Eumeta japonica]|uniref:Uncharacterized protein n=1 Tax=Eumeta variegata TaxID=151549 RepID=A0A4C1ZY22_EUMVA|nr:hypothetical protein EVAR_84672_1 [Eumeta japonica]